MNMFRIVLSSVCISVCIGVPLGFSQDAESETAQSLSPGSGKLGLLKEVELVIASNAVDSHAPQLQQPLMTVAQASATQSILELSKGSPLYAPIEGLPEAYWKDEVCSNCHNWTQANLCEQGQFYLAQDSSPADRTKHPYGGSFKEALRLWASAGCKE